MSKKTLIISLILMVVIAGGQIFMYFHSVKKQKDDEINTFLKENNLQELVKDKQIVYNSKLGVYHAIIVFKDEPNNRYEIYIDKKAADVTAYDQSNVEITDKNKAKYIQ